MNPASSKKVILIVGPTAVGKTALALALAKKYQAEIISADSRQCYRELSIGVARPSPGELAQVPHYFIASHSIQETVTAITFEQYALQKLEEIFRKKNTVIMVGGTGLYIKAFCEGLDEIPEIDPAVRSKIMGDYEKKGIGWLQTTVREKDPLFFEKGEWQNPQRLMRALEVVETTGRSIISFQRKEKVKRDFEIIKIGLELPRKELVQHINDRVGQMMNNGLLEEVRSLLPVKNLNALQTVGYAELFDHLDGKISLPDAIERIRINTRQYAKRQMTWFRKDPGIKWFHPGDLSGIEKYLENYFPQSSQSAQRN